MRKVYSKTIYKNGKIEWNLTEKDYNYKIKKIKSYERKSNKVNPWINK